MAQAGLGKEHFLVPCGVTGGPWELWGQRGAGCGPQAAARCRARTPPVPQPQWVLH